MNSRTIYSRHEWGKERGRGQRWRQTKRKLECRTGAVKFQPCLDQRLEKSIDLEFYSFPGLSLRSADPQQVIVLNCLIKSKGLSPSNPSPLKFWSMVPKPSWSTDSIQIKNNNINFLSYCQKSLSSEISVRSRVHKRLPGVSLAGLGTWPRWPDDDLDKAEPSSTLGCFRAHAQTQPRRCSFSRRAFGTGVGLTGHSEACRADLQQNTLSNSSGYLSNESIKSKIPEGFASLESSIWPRFWLAETSHAPVQVLGSHLSGGLDEQCVTCTCNVCMKLMQWQWQCLKLVPKVHSKKN